MPDPTLTPVVGDPFAGPWLSPVAGDPFQQNLALTDYARTLPNIPAQPELGQPGGAPLNDFGPAPTTVTPQPALPALADVAGDPSRSLAVRISAAIGSSLADQGLGLAKSAWGAATLPGDVARGLVDPSSPEAIRRSTDLAGLLTLPSVGAEANPDVLNVMGYHGSPNKDLTTISASPPVRQFDNGTSALGAFFAPSEQGAVRYAGDTGRVYSTDVPLKNPYEMPVSQFLYLQDPTKDALGKSLPGEQWASRLEELKNEGATLRQQLTDAGHDGVIIKNSKGQITEMASFNDVPLSLTPVDHDPFAEAGTAQPTTPPPPSITAYHGSPHSFDQFDLSKIGTGEGAQAYGHGMYFSQSENVAKSYRDALGEDAVKIGDQTIVPERGTPEDLALAHLRDATLSQSTAPYQKASQTLRSYDRNDPRFDAAIKTLGDWQEAGATPTTKGSMYQVAINADPDHFLDWDKPLSEQHPVVRGALSQLGVTSGRGDQLHDMVANAMSKKDMANMLAASGQGSDALRSYLSGPEVPYPVQAATALRDAGVPGIKYLDADSRTAGNGSKNYVVFDDRAISILKKYGLAGLGLAAGGAALMGQPQPARASGVRLTPVTGNPFAQ